MIQDVVTVCDYSCRYSASEPLRLQKLSLHVALGEFIAIVGPSGGGKSSLAFSLNGIIPHEIVGSETSGTVNILNLDVHLHPPHQLVRVIGTVLQDPEWQLVSFTVTDEIAFGLENQGVPREDMIKRVEEMLQLLNLEGLRERSPDELSGGQKQRVAIASCLAMQPPILLLDEPVAELDPLGKQTVMTTLARLNRQQGITILLIEHNLDIVVPYADRLIVIADGQVVSDGKPQDVLQHQALLQSIGLCLPQLAEIALALPSTLRPDVPPLTVAAFRDVLLSTSLEAKSLAPLSVGPQKVSGEENDACRQRLVADFQHVWYRYPGGQQTLCDLSLEIRQGEYIGLIGQNGSGKSTLAKVLVGLLRPQRGDVFLGAEPLSQLSRKEIVRRVGYVFQNPDMQFFTKTCFDEVAFGLRLQNLPESEISRRVSEILKRLDVAEYKQVHPHFLSRGQRRRIALASVLVLEPEIIILDEPTTGLDTGTALRLLEVIQALHKRGHTIILLTHEMSAVLAYCTRLVLIDDGVIKMDDDPQRAFQRQELFGIYHMTPPPVAELINGLPWTTPYLLPRTSQNAAKLLAEFVYSLHT